MVLLKLARWGIGHGIVAGTIAGLIAGLVFIFSNGGPPPAHAVLFWLVTGAVIGAGLGIPGGVVFGVIGGLINRKAGWILAGAAAGLISASTIFLGYRIIDILWREPLVYGALIGGGLYGAAAAYTNQQVWSRRLSEVQTILSVLPQKQKYRKRWLSIISLLGILYCVRCPVHYTYQLPGNYAGINAQRAALQKIDNSFSYCVCTRKLTIRLPQRALLYYTPHKSLLEYEADPGSGISDRWKVDLPKIQQLARSGKTFKSLEPYRTFGFSEP
ncbi:hypothetical protein [Nibrella saemangeumensis]|uniref:hypothetical protein n=1 Tax=Nibrella saemangeumensis TaxID=1084526 RepID=UPI0031F16D46